MKRDAQTSGVERAASLPLLLAAPAMGTRFELVLCRGDRADPALRSAGEEALREIVEIDAKLSRFRRDSVVSFLQREAVARPVPIEADLFELFAECEAIRVASEGLFDVGVGSAMERWGFHDQLQVQLQVGKLDNEDPSFAEPSDAEEAAWPAGASYRLDAATNSIQLCPGVRLDLGGVAKGFALDRAALILRDLGIDRALLHGGTSAVVAIGAPPDRAAWSIRLALPKTADTSRAEHSASAPPTIELRDAALAVSTPLGRVLEDPAPEALAPNDSEVSADSRPVRNHLAALRSHIIDPRTGEPLHPECLPSLVAVRGPRCVTCDAWTKPTLLSGARPIGLGPAYECIFIR